jgi:hypothetical protein
LKLKFAPKLVTAQVLRTAGWEENTSALAEAECLIKEKQALGLAKPVRSRPTPDLLLNLLKLFYIRPAHKSSEKLCFQRAWTARRPANRWKTGKALAAGTSAGKLRRSKRSDRGERPQNNTFFLCQLGFDVAFEDADCRAAYSWG